MAATLVIRRKSFSRACFTTGVWLVAPALGCVAIALINRRGIPESPYFRSFSQALRWDWLIQLSKRPWFMAEYVLRGITSPRVFGFCWQFVTLALVVLRRPRVNASVIFWRLTAAAVIVGYFLVLTISPLHFEYQLRTALFRLAIHFLPLVLLIGTEQLSAAGWTRQVAISLSRRRTPALTRSDTNGLDSHRRINR